LVDLLFIQSMCKYLYRALEKRLQEEPAIYGLNLNYICNYNNVINIKVLI